MKFSIQNRDNTLILNILFGSDYIDANFSPTIEVLSDFMKLQMEVKNEVVNEVTNCFKNKWNIIDIHCMDSWQISF